MTPEVCLPDAKPVAAEREQAHLWPRSAIIAWTALALLLIIGVPLFLNMGLWADIVFYGLLARDIVNGGVVERDLNVWVHPPMMAWILAAVRWLFGWSTRTINLIDLAFISGNVWLLALWLKRAGLSQVGRVWTAFAIYAFYFATTEWCHSQPDLWMMVPALGGLHLRRRQIARLIRPKAASWNWVAADALVEGLVWGAGCLFKPFVAVPGFICWLITVVVVARTGSRPIRRLVLDSLSLLVGGLLAGGLWFAWLWWDGGWSAFWNDYAIWGKHYYDRTNTIYTSTMWMFQGMWPWNVIHVVAIPAAVVVVVRVVWRAVAGRLSGEEPRLWQGALLAGFYLGWLWQANYVQWTSDYHQAPTIILAMALIASQNWFRAQPVELGGHSWLLVRSPLIWIGLGIYLGLEGLTHPLLNTNRLAWWPSCFGKSATPEVRDQLTLDVTYPLNWVNLDRVEQFLRSQKVRDGQVTCYSMQSMSLLLDLNIKHSTRTLFHSFVTWRYPDDFHQKLFRQELDASGQRFVVTDLHELGYTREQLAAEPTSQSPGLPPDFPEQLKDSFPWCEPVVFRAGNFVVHRVTGPIKELKRYVVGARPGTGTPGDDTP